MSFHYFLSALLQAANKVIEKTLSNKVSPPKQVLQQQLQKKQVQQHEQQKKQLQQQEQQKKQMQQKEQQKKQLQQEQQGAKPVGASQQRLDQQKLKQIYEVNKFCICSCVKNVTEVL